MIDGKFDIVFAGRIVPSKTEAEVKQNLARLFKTQPENIERLFSGQEVSIKKGLDYAQAMKYQSALKQAGALVLLKKQEPASAPANVSTTPSAALSANSETSHTRTPDTQSDAAESAASADSSHSDALPVTTEEEADWSLANAGEKLPAQAKAEPIPEPDLSALDLAAVGEQLSERQATISPEVDTSGLSLGELGRLSPEQAKPTRDVDTSALSVANAGEKIPTEKVNRDPVNPNTDHLTLD